MAPALAGTLMAILYRAAGGGIFPYPTVDGIAARIVRRAPEVLIGLLTLTAVYLASSSLILGALGGIITFFGIETGHGTAYMMGHSPAQAQSGRKQFLSRIIDPVCKLLKAPLGKGLYCSLFIGMKGLWVNLSLYPIGLLGAILWPLGYSIGWMLRKAGLQAAMPTVIGEYVTGFGGGLILWYYMRYAGVIQ